MAVPNCQFPKQTFQNWFHFPLFIIHCYSSDYQLDWLIDWSIKSQPLNRFFSFLIGSLSLSRSLTISILIVESWRSGPIRRRTTRRSRSRIIAMQRRLHRNRPPIRLSPSTHLLFLRGLFSFSSNFCLFREKTITRKKERSFFLFFFFFLVFGWRENLKKERKKRLRLQIL